MKYVLKFFLYCSIIVFAINSTFFAYSDSTSYVKSVCCYDKNSGRISSQSGCNIEDIEIALYPDGKGMDKSPCSIWEDYKVAYKVSSYKCSQTMNGKTIYNESSILSYLRILESQLIPLSECSSSATDNEYNTNTDSSSNTNTGNSETYQDVNTNDVDIGINVESQITEEAIKSCTDTGGVYGFFSSEDSCNSIVGTQEYNKCLFNPFLAGLLGSKYTNIDPDLLNFSVFENSCIPSLLISSCHDYKTKNNCEDPSLKLDCKWIESSVFTPDDKFKDKDGLCITNNTISIDDVYYNQEGYFYRLNLIKNPSFEFVCDNWNNCDEGKLWHGPIEVSYHGENMYQLENNFISQIIYNLKEGVDYLASAYVLAFFGYNNLSDKINISIDYYNSTHNLIESYNNSILFSELYSQEQYFSKAERRLNFKYASFGTHKIPKGTDHINFSIKAKNVLIDGISFMPFKENNQEIYKKIFSPVEVISSSASYCQLCYDDLNFNFCTKKKSDLLGDCSYMVESVDKPYESEFDEDDNYMGNSNIYSGELKWKSQSLPNSKLFCELYITEDSCIDLNNYVNSKYSSLHPLSKSGQLCKWDVQKGCFKDSDNNNAPDTRIALFDYMIPVPIYRYPYLRLFSGNQYQVGGYFVDYDQIWNSNDIYYNGIKPINDLKYTDFDLGCDVVPPNFYVYFTAVDLFGEPMVLIRNYNQNITGDLYVSLDIEDNTDFESCDGFQFPRKLYVDYAVTNSKGITNYSAKVIDSSTFFISESIKDFFTIDEQFIGDDGINNFSLIVKDQSGNIAKNINFSFNIDSSGPIIDLFSHGLTSYRMITALEDTTNPIILTNTSILRFNVSDFSNVTSCSFKLSPIRLGCEDSGFCIPDSLLYNSSGDINLNSVIVSPADGYDHKSFDWRLGDYIYNASSKSSNDLYNLSITCQDVFAQKSIWNGSFIVDFSTDLVLVKEKIFVDEKTYLGFFNSPFNLILASMAKDLSICNFLFYDGTSGVFTIQFVEDGFSIPNVDTSIKYYSNITYSGLSFSSDGKKEGKAICVDKLDNSASEELIYYYDTKNPQINNFGINSYSIGGKLSSIKVENKYYTHVGSSTIRDFNSLGPGIINISVNATGTFLDKNSLNLSLIDSSNLPITQGNFLSNSVIFKDFNITNVTTLPDSFKISNYFPFQTLIVGADSTGYLFKGIKIQDEKDLYLLKYSLNFSDMANNTNTYYFEIYSDLSTPSYNFSGDILTFDSQNRLFTNKKVPQIKLSFNAPSYRKYKCRITGNSVGDTYQTSTFSETNNLIFKISDISSNLNLEDNSDLKIRIICADQYNITLDKTYSLIYDDKDPVLKGIYLEKGNKKYFENVHNMVYENYTDSLIFELNDTKELSYTCNYRFLSKNDEYRCNETWKKITFTNPSANKVINNLNILTGKDSGSLDFNPKFDALSCYRKIPEFDNKQNSNQNFGLNLTIEAYCEDAIGKRTGTLNLVVNTFYVSNSIIDFYINYTGGKAIPVVKLTSPALDKIYISLNDDGKDPLYKFDSSEGIEEGGLYVYRANTGLDLSKLHDRSSTIWAVSKTASGTIKDKKSTTIIIDNLAPSVNLDIPGLMNGIIYTSRFNIDFSADDGSGIGIDRVELYSNNKIIFTSTNLSDFDNLTISRPDSSLNFLSADGKKYTGKVVFNNSQANHNSIISLVAYDKYNNKNETRINFIYNDSFTILLSDSNSAKVDTTRLSWVTRNNAPVINFRTTKTADYCTIYPMVNPEWKNITGNPNIAVENSITINAEKTFSVDLSTFSGFNLSKLSNIDNKIRIICSYNFVDSIHDYNLKYLNLLPDYVLESEKGFLLTDSPYTTKIKVTSVGPYRYINCNYTLGSNEFEFSGDDKTSFTDEVNFSKFSEGSHNLTLLCSDLVGNLGPEKNYEFIVDKNSNIELSDLELIKMGKSYFLDGNTIYVPSGENLELKFKLNKNSGVSCNLIINPTGTAFSQIVSFFRNLFSIGKKELSLGDMPYEFKSSNLNFPYVNGVDNALTINCKGLSSLNLNPYSNTFYVKKLDDNLNVNVSVS